MPVEIFPMPIPVTASNAANFPKLAQHLLDLLNDFNARGDVLPYGAR